MVKHQHDDGADNRHEHAVEVETSNASSANSGEDEASDNRSDYAENNVEKETLTGLVDDLAAYKPGDQAEYDLADNRHVIPFPPRRCVRQPPAPALSSNVRDASHFLRHEHRKPPYPARTYRRRGLLCRNPCDHCNGRFLSSN